MIQVYRMPTNDKPAGGTGDEGKKDLSETPQGKQTLLGWYVHGLLLCCYDKIPGRNNLKEKGFVLAHGFKEFSHHDQQGTVERHTHLLSGEEQREKYQFSIDFLVFSSLFCTDVSLWIVSATYRHPFS